MELDRPDQGEWILLQALAKLPRNRRDVSSAYVINQILLCFFVYQPSYSLRPSDVDSAIGPVYVDLTSWRSSPPLENKDHQSKSLPSSLISLQHHLFPWKPQLGLVAREIISL